MLHVDPDATGADTLVLEASDQEEGIPLVPEAIAAHEPTKDAILSLRREGVHEV